ncbi:uncharacterized protein LOC113863438 [Abrus precatorius]|uniref:Uncharacterized protein LOC113863438 n=1 Tax=Abrus precatorius TaxID=3816 RepID=A0A8B8L9C0_ABRPR|nr:uncharacterized protein LOC113863438 [Abrus precatorius]
MFNAKSDEVLPHKTVLQIKQDDKFFSRLLSKESSMSHPSFRMAVAVPFVWESQPGTPKYTFYEETLPPLTPPPSYYFNSITATKNKPLKKRSKSNLLSSLFTKLHLKKTTLSPSSLSSFSSPSFSSLSSSDSSHVVLKLGRRRFLSFGSSFDFRGVDDEEGVSFTSPTSTLCFGIPRSASSISNSTFRGSCRR